MHKPVQPGFASKLVDHKELIEAKFGPAIALVKVLQITDSKAFVTAYGSLLEARWQNADAMQQALALLDVTKDVAVTRLNMFRAAIAGGGSLTVRCHRCYKGCSAGPFQLSFSGTPWKAAIVPLDLVTWPPWQEACRLCVSDPAHPAHRVWPLISMRCCGALTWPQWP